MTIEENITDILKVQDEFKTLLSKLNLKVMLTHEEALKKRQLELAINGFNITLEQLRCYLKFPFTFSRK